MSVLSGLAFTEYIFIGCVIFLGMSGGKHGPPGNNNNNSDHAPIARAKKTTGYERPYSAYGQPEPVHQYSPPAKHISAQQSQSSYDEHNPQFSYHLQQLSLQQQAQTKKQSTASVPAPNNDLMNHQRGRLQVLHNQRQRAPAPPVPAKPINNNSNLYRY